MAAAKAAASKAAASKAAGGGQGTKLVIVESPSKARTIAGYLGKGYVVESSVGHIRDMPDRAAEIPPSTAASRGPGSGVNVDDDFEPLYVVHSDKRQQVAKLKSLLKDADELLLATDEDRKGEAIAWHLLRGDQTQGPPQAHGLPRDYPRGHGRAIEQPPGGGRGPGGRLAGAARAGPAGTGISSPPCCGTR